MNSGRCNISIDYMGYAHIWQLSDSKINFLPLSEKLNLYVFILLASPWVSVWFMMTNVKMFVIMRYIILRICSVVSH